MLATPNIANRVLLLYVSLLREVRQEFTDNNVHEAN